jgi:hypothetical protein
MYSAELDKGTVLDLHRILKPHLPDLAKKLSAINKILLGDTQSLRGGSQEGAGGIRAPWMI